MNDCYISNLLHDFCSKLLCRRMRKWEPAVVYSQYTFWRQRDFLGRYTQGLQLRRYTLPPAGRYNDKIIIQLRNSIGRNNRNTADICSLLAHIIVCESKDIKHRKMGEKLLPNVASPEQNKAFAI